MTKTLDRVQLSPLHREAVNRRRRIVLQYDVLDRLGSDWDQWFAYVMGCTDEPGNQVDAIWWDVGGGDRGTYPSVVLPPSLNPGLRRWWDQGRDWVGELVQAGRRSGLEVFWNHRANDVDYDAAGQPARNPLKAAHPDWVLAGWSSEQWSGLWNYAVPEVRAHHLAVLGELADNYEWDGFQLDFSRHVPFLPPGQQWELRESLTDFVRRVRALTLEVERRRGRPFLLAAKVPQTIEGCHVDGFDVATWAAEDLVDLFTLGSRSMDVDLAAFRRITAGHGIKLLPCHDDWHTTDGYLREPIEFLRGICANWWQQGADGVVAFNWFSGSTAAYPGIEPPFLHEMPVQRQTLREIGSPETLAGQDKFFAVERRGGYPWADGFFNRNDTAPLPRLLTGGEPARLTVSLGDDLPALAARLRQVTLRLVLFGAAADEPVEVVLNGVALPVVLRDAEWKDALIHSPEPQPPSGGITRPEIDSTQRLLRLDYAVPPEACQTGENEVQLRLPAGAPALQLEKLEVHVEYR